MNKKAAKLYTFAFIVGGATAIYLYFSNKNKKIQPPKIRNRVVYFSAIVNTSTSDLNVREEPNTNSKIIDKLKKGTKILVKYFGDDNNTDWVELLDNISKNKIGYVSTQYLIINTDITSLKNK